MPPSRFSPRHRALLAAAALLALLAWSLSASAIVSSMLAGKGVSTLMDVRSVDEVKNDTAVDAALTAKFAAEEGDDFKSIAALVFASRVVLVGFARTPDIRRRAEAIAKSEHGYRRFKDDIIVGAASGDAVSNLALDEKINAVLTTTPGIHSVNMRWKVFGGDVFVMGLAKSRREADLAIKTIRQVDGVRNVHSALDVGKT